ncbi:MAG: pantetheine-phosphate adenylyltransferase [Clostridia bacterium]|nr:pantetheine-phosphate adenylyltransferase [Clostridia bacterium]
MWDGRCYHVKEKDLEFDLSKVEGSYKKCVYPGTFDPITVGHIDIVSRASKLFDEVIVLIADNPSKTNKADVKFRINCAEQALREFDNVKVESWDGLLVDYLIEKGVNTIIRGIRNARDLEYEMPMAEMNRQLNDKIETVFLAAKPEYAHISSTAVREINMLGGNINSLIPACVAENMKKRKEEG